MASTSPLQFPTGDPARDERLLDRYFAGECTPDEQSSVDAWLGAFPAARARAETVRHVARYPASVTQAPSGPELWAAFRARVHAVEEERIAERESLFASRPARRRFGGRLPRHSRTIWSSVAATLGAALLLVVGWYGGTQRLTNRLSARMSTYTTANGERATITLPDGSQVMLNVASRLEVPSNYAEGNRTLRLTGEAFFTVVHGSQSPFVVIAGPGSARVLGTSFAVRHYRTDRTATVAVQDGKVAVGAVVLSASQQADVSATHVVTRSATHAGRFGFVHGALTLDDMPLETAIVELNRWYDADVRIGDASLSALRIQGSFIAGSLSDLVEYLELTGVRVVRDGRTLTLYKN